MSGKIGPGNCHDLSMQKSHLKIHHLFILIPTYNSASFIEKTIQRIPQEIWHQTEQVVIVNDGSTDQTKQIVAKLQARYPQIHLLNQSPNQGYASAQKTGFDYCLEKGAGIVALLHDDGQYAPEELPILLDPIEKNKADIVQGSRMLKKRRALKGHMPLLKFVANRILSRLENIICGMDLAEFHSGYMVYSKKALTTIPYKRLSNTYHIDGEMLFMGHKKGLRIAQLSISTNYLGDARSGLKPLRYLIDLSKILVKYKLGKYNF